MRWSCGFWTYADGWRFHYVEAADEQEARDRAALETGRIIDGCVQPAPATTTTQD